MPIIEIKINNLPQIKEAFNKAPANMMVNLNKAIKQTVFFIQAQAMRNAPVKTGRLRASAYSTFSPLIGETGFTAKYAAWVHDGTSPYTIYPNAKKALFWAGASHPVKRVNHPGIRANPFLQRAVDDSQSQVDNFFETAVQDVLNDLAKEMG